MAIVLNEYEWAERMINKRDLGKKPGETLSRVAKYYFENGHSKREVRKLLDQFLIQCDPDASLVRWSDSLDKITRNASKFPLVQIDYIRISDSELKRIDSIDSKLLRRLAFTMLCVSKYWNTVSDSNNSWLNTPDTEIFQMANILGQSKRHDLMYGALRELGYIRLSKKIDNLNVQVLFGDAPGEPTDGGICIKDFRNLGYQYLKYCGEDFFECESCGITIRSIGYSPKRSIRGRGSKKAHGPRCKYCASCAAEIKTIQSINAVMRKRSSRPLT